MMLFTIYIPSEGAAATHIIAKASVYHHCKLKCTKEGVFAHPTSISNFLHALQLSTNNKNDGMKQHNTQKLKQPSSSKLFTIQNTYKPTFPKYTQSLLMVACLLACLLGCCTSIHPCICVSIINISTSSSSSTSSHSLSHSNPGKAAASAEAATYTRKLLYTHHCMQCIYARL